jgi:hypothetical protein
VEQVGPPDLLPVNPRDHPDLGPGVQVLRRLVWEECK